MSTTRLSYGDVEDFSSVVITVVQSEEISDENGDITEVKKTDLDKETFEVNALSEDMQTRLTAYGLKQFLSDRKSAVKEAAGKLSGMREVFEMLKKDEWNIGRAGGEGRKARAKKIDPYLAQAVAEIKGVDAMAIVKKLETLTTEEIKTLYANETVQEKIKEVKEKALKAAEDLDLNI